MKSKKCIPNTSNLVFFLTLFQWIIIYFLNNNFNYRHDVRFEVGVTMFTGNVNILVLFSRMFQVCKNGNILVLFSRIQSLSSSCQPREQITRKHRHNPQMSPSHAHTFFQVIARKTLHD